jgi:hypothetical protein
MKPTKAIRHTRFWLAPALLIVPFTFVATHAHAQPCSCGPDEHMFLMPIGGGAGGSVVYCAANAPRTAPIHMCSVHPQPPVPAAPTPPPASHPPPIPPILLQGEPAPKFNLGSLPVSPPPQEHEDSKCVVVVEMCQKYHIDPNRARHNDGAPYACGACVCFGLSC